MTLKLKNFPYLEKSSSEDLKLHYETYKLVVDQLKEKKLAHFIDVHDTKRVYNRMFDETTFSVNSFTENLQNKEEILEIVKSIQGYAKLPLKIQQQLPDAQAIKDSVDLFYPKILGPYCKSDVVGTASQAKLDLLIPMKNLDYFGEAINKFCSFFDFSNFHYCSILIDLIDQLGSSLVYLAVEHKFALMLGFSLFYKVVYFQSFQLIDNFKLFIEKCNIGLHITFQSWKLYIYHQPLVLGIAITIGTLFCKYATGGLTAEVFRLISPETYKLFVGSLAYHAGWVGLAIGSTKDAFIKGLFGNQIKGVEQFLDKVFKSLNVIKK